MTIIENNWKFSPPSLITLYFFLPLTKKHGKYEFLITVFNINLCV